MFAYSTGVSRWSDTTGITVMSHAGNEKKLEQTMPSLYSRTGGQCKSLKKKLGKTDSKYIRLTFGLSKCQGVMQIISFIEDQQVIRDILTHLELWLVRSRPPPACACTADRPKICAVTLSESKPPIPSHILHIHKPTITPILNIHATIIQS